MLGSEVFDQSLAPRLKQWREREGAVKRPQFLVCFLTDDLSVLPENKEFVKRLFEYEYRRLASSRNLTLISAFDVELGMLKALKYNDYDYLVFIKLGADLRGFLEHLEHNIPDGTALMGHILDRTDRNFYYEIHDQTIVIERKWVQELSTIPFKVQLKEDNLKAVERSKTNFHDHYTPLWISSGNGSVNVKSVAPGGLWVDHLLGKAKVEIFNDSLRKEKKFYYPDSKIIGRESLNFEISDHFDPFFPVGLEPVRANSLNTTEKPVQNLYSVCSTLKPFLLLKELGFNNETRVHFFDYSRVAVAVMKYLWNHWDGRQYPQIIRSFRHMAKSVSTKDLDEYWDFFKGEFNSEKDRISFLNSLRETVKVEFKVANILEENYFNNYFQTPGDGKDDYVWLSNCFNYKPTMVSGDRRNIDKKNDEVLSAFRSQKPEATIDCYNIKQPFIPVAKAKNILLLKGVSYENVAHYSETFSFIQKNLEAHQHYCLLPDSSKPTHWDFLSRCELPFLELPVPLPQKKIYEEIQNLNEPFFKHRPDASGWTSIVLHGLGPDKTRSHDYYGYKSEDEAPYSWTPIADKIPTLKNWIVNELVKKRKLLSELYRVRIMKLSAGGFIEPHRDSESTARYFRAINIAINNPKDCIMTFKDFGPVPFEDGKSFLIDNSYTHSLCNGSSQDRYHIIVHGRLNINQESIYG